MAYEITDFHEGALELEMSISEFQAHFIDVLIYIFDFIFSALFVGLFAYWFKGLRTWKYLAIGLLMKYWSLLLIVCIFIFKGEFSPEEWFASLLHIIMIQSLVILLGSFVGTKIAAKHDYLDEKDKTGLFFCGLSKKFWFLITFAYNPIYEYLKKLLVFSFYSASKLLTEFTDLSEFFNKGGFISLLIMVLLPFVLFAISLKLFSIGIKAVKNKKAKLRKLKIIGYLIVIPLLLILIPIMRNRTWFFF